MFDWVLNTPLNTITFFFSCCFQIKVDEFLHFFFSMINFSYQYLPEAKGYLERSRRSTIELFREKNFFFCRIQKKTPVPESLFNKDTGLYPATSLKERTPTHVFSDDFCEILKTEHPRTAVSVLRKNILPIK